MSDDKDQGIKDEELDKVSGGVEVGRPIPHQPDPHRPIPRPPEPGHPVGGDPITPQ